MASITEIITRNHLAVSDYAEERGWGYDEWLLSGSRDFSLEGVPDVFRGEWIAFVSALDLIHWSYKQVGLSYEIEREEHVYLLVGFPDQFQSTQLVRWHLSEAQYAQGYV